MAQSGERQRSGMSAAGESGLPVSSPHLLVNRFELCFSVDDPVAN
jgi:hypothetical protein